MSADSAASVESLDPRVWARRLGKSQRQRALAIAFFEGAVVAAMFACTEQWLVPLLKVRLGAAAQLIGWVTVVPSLVWMLAGPFVSAILPLLGGNKRACVLHTYAQAAVLVALSIPLHAPDAPWALPLATTLVMLNGALAIIGGPAWQAWMGELVPERVRGRYLGQRLRVFMFVKLCFAALFAWIMHLSPAGAGPWGLQILLAVAALSRFASAWMQQLQHEPPLRRAPVPASRVLIAESVGLWGFVRTMHRSTLGRWTLVWSLLHFGVQISSPFFQPYMLAQPGSEAGLVGLDLGDPADPWASYTFTLLIQTSMVVRLFAYGTVGRLVDRFGPAAILRAAVIGITLVPAAWIFTTDLRVIFLGEIASGIAWAMAECAVTGLLLSTSSDPRLRAQLIGYHWAVTSLAIVAGSLLGTLLLPHLPALLGSSYRTIFLISVCLRVPALLLALRFLPTVPDWRPILGLWRAIPGLQLTAVATRALFGFLRRGD